jgi:hypothetical protein
VVRHWAVMVLGQPRPAFVVWLAKSDGGHHPPRPKHLPLALFFSRQSSDAQEGGQMSSATEVVDSLEQYSFVDEAGSAARAALPGHPEEGC